MKEYQKQVVESVANRLQHLTELCEATKFKAVVECSDFAPKTLIQTTDGVTVFSFGSSSPKEQSLAVWFANHPDSIPAAFLAKSAMRMHQFGDDYGDGVYIELIKSSRSATSEELEQLENSTYHIGRI